MRTSGHPAAKVESISGIDHALFAHHARHHVAKKQDIGFAVAGVIDLGAEAMSFEFRQNVGQSGAAKFELIERLDSGKARSSAPIGRTRRPVRPGPRAHRSA